MSLDVSSHGVVFFSCAIRCPPVVQHPFVRSDCDPGGGDDDGFDDAGTKHIRTHSCGRGRVGFFGAVRDQFETRGGKPSRLHGGW